MANHTLTQNDTYIIYAIYNRQCDLPVDVMVKSKILSKTQELVLSSKSCIIIAPIIMLIWEERFQGSMMNIHIHVCHMGTYLIIV